MTLHKALHSKALLGLGVVVALAVPISTVPRIPEVNPWPVLAGLVPWILAKYLLCPLRWRLLTAHGPDGAQTRTWHLRAYAESELFGLLTPGHVGADVWRLRRLTRTGLGRADGLLSVGLDRLVGAIGLSIFVAMAATELPKRQLIIAAAFGVVVVAAGLVTRRMRPRLLLPSGPLPRPRALLLALLYSAGYQLSIAGMLLGTVAATGHSLSLFQLLGAFGASQLAGAIPGPNGASPKDAALVVALVALGLPWLAATAAVTIRATLAWLPALTLGGVSLWLLRRQPGAPAALAGAAI